MFAYRNQYYFIYSIHSELLKANPDKLVVMKFYASYCQACKALEPMFIRVKEDKQLTNLPIVWAEWQSQRNNKDLFGRLGVLALPTVHFYDGSRGLIENFPCGPAKLPLLKQKLARFLNTRVDSQTLQLKDASEAQDDRSELDSEPAVERNVDTDNALITDEHINFLRNGMIFFQDLTDEEFTELLRKGRLLTFNPGDVIMRQGMPPTTFYVLKSGLAEMCIRSKFDDPIKTPPNYLGAVVNNLKSFDYFGERALSTGEPYAASVRVLEKTRAFAFHADDIPESSILSKKRKANDELTKQLSQRYELPKDYAPNYPVTQQDACVLELLVRFKQIRQVAKGFKYIMDSNPTFGDRGEIARRSVLVSKLSKAQRDEFQEVFDLIDVNKRGVISLMEIKKFMESARETKSTYELMQMLILANPNGISRDEFFGLMAEGEFYNLFTETFQELDPGNTGYVRAGDLDDVLGGVRDLIGDDSTSIIDTEDKDMLVDYEQFSKMLLGAAL